MSNSTQYPFSREAIHEAGHAVMAIQHGHRVKQLDLRKSATPEAFQLVKPLSLDMAQASANVAILLAGYAAEVMTFGNPLSKSSVSDMLGIIGELAKGRDTSDKSGLLALRVAELEVILKNEMLFETLHAIATELEKRKRLNEIEIRTIIAGLK